MLICLSSGLRPRYKEDILRSLSMPTGSNLRFRYETKIVSKDLLDKLRHFDFLDKEVLVCYLDCNVKGNPPQLIPCRFGNLISSNVYGNFCILNFELQSFADVCDIEEFNKSIRATKLMLPTWNNRSLDGDFCLYTDRQPGGVTKSQNVETWQQVVLNLKSTLDFKDEPFFYSVLGLFEINNEGVTEDKNCKKIAMSYGQYTVKPKKSYDIKILQVGNETDDEHQIVNRINWLISDVQGESINMLTNSRLAIDSPYDEKTIRFITKSLTTDTISIITLFRLVAPTEDPKLQNGVMEFDIPVKVLKSTPWKAGLIIGGLLGCQGAIPTLQKSTGFSDIVTVTVVITVGLFTGIVAAYNLRKP